MTVRHRVRAAVARLPQAALVLVVLQFMLRQAAHSQGGETVWAFSSDERHRQTAMAMLTGTLRLRNGLSTVGGDEQVFSGAGYTNWGFGVPAMQLPFHAVARWLAKHSTGAKGIFPYGCYPDRAIYFTYVALLIPVLWLALDRMLASRRSDRSGWLTRNALSATATVVIMTCAVYPLTTSRFIVYEETMAYFVILQLFALSAYLMLGASRSPWPAAVLGAVAAMGFLTRPTGLVYLAMWAVLLVLDRRRLNYAVVFASAAAPIVGFTLYSNWVKAGSPFSFGFENALPWYAFHIGMQRFAHYRCADTPAHAWLAAKELFDWLFFYVTDPTDPHLQRCHFMSELRSPDNSREGFLGLPVLLLLAWVTGHYVVRRERRLALYLPIATFVFLFFNYARTVGFAWRYVGDFWPLIALIGAQYARWLPVASLPRVRLAAAFALIATQVRDRQVEPARWTVTNLMQTQLAGIPERFEKSRYSVDPPLPQRIMCGPAPSWPYHNGRGWGASCEVETHTNVYLGVPKKDGDGYELRFAAEGLQAPSLRAYVNGRIYTADRAGAEYKAKLRLDYRSLHSPAVMVTVEWTADPEPRPAKLLWIELV
jgi:hypothetical protein